MARAKEQVNLSHALDLDYDKMRAMKAYVRELSIILGKRSLNGEKLPKPNRNPQTEKDILSYLELFKPTEPVLNHGSYFEVLKVLAKSEYPDVLLGAAKAIHSLPLVEKLVVENVDQHTFTSFKFVPNKPDQIRLALMVRDRSEYFGEHDKAIRKELQKHIPFEKMPVRRSSSEMQMTQFRRAWGTLVRAVIPKNLMTSAVPQP